VATAGEVSIWLPSVAVHCDVSDEAVVVLIAVSGETPEWPASARNIGQSETGVLGRWGLVPWPEWLGPAAPDSFAPCTTPACEVALAVPATVKVPARAAPAATVTSAGLN
jgi:hypothetical protein